MLAEKVEKGSDQMSAKAKGYLAAGANRSGGRGGSDSPVPIPKPRVTVPRGYWPPNVANDNLPRAANDNIPPRPPSNPAGANVRNPLVGPAAQGLAALLGSNAHQAASYALGRFQQIGDLPFMNPGGWDVYDVCQGGPFTTWTGGLPLGALCFPPTVQLFNPSPISQDFPASTNGGTVWGRYESRAVGDPQGWAFKVMTFARSASMNPAPYPYQSPAFNFPAPFTPPPFGNITDIGNDPMPRYGIAPPGQTEPPYDPTAGQMPSPRLALRAAPRPRPPRPGVREKKFTGSRNAARLGSLIGFNAATEIRDALQVLWGNIPAKDRGYYGSPSLQRMAADIWNHWDDIEWGPWVEKNKRDKYGLHRIPGQDKSGALYGLARNALQDAIYGGLGVAGASAARNLNHSTDATGRAENKISALLGGKPPSIQRPSYPIKFGQVPPAGYNGTDRGMINGWIAPGQDILEVLGIPK